MRTQRPTATDRPLRHAPVRRAVAQVLLAALFAVPPGLPVRAEISGEHVVSGEVSFDAQGDVLTIQASDGAIIEYDTLSVWANEELHFVQPHSQATVLNRVFAERTQIHGGVFANGIVYIVNPAGIFFGSTAVVDVGGLVAAAGDIANEDFLKGVDRFDLAGEVRQEGEIQAASVALLGRSVANHGRIHAPDGTIALVAGSRVLLTRPGGHLHIEVEGPAGGGEGPALEQTGTVDAGDGGVSFVTGDVYSLALNHEGITRGRDIELRAASGTVQVAGRLDASDRRAGARGGSIAVTGERVALVGAELDASGDAGEGGIRVGGDLRGQGALPNARRTFVDAASRLRADALSRGDGGRVIVWADEATAFHGALSARGGHMSGDGGFAEISGAVVLFADGEVDLRAVHGETGTLLYDPQDIRIVGGSADGSDDPDPDPDRLEGSSLGQILFADLGDGASPFLIFESEIEGTNANLVLEATHSITSTGTFDHDSGLGEAVGTVRLPDTRSLTLRTRNDPGDEAGSPEAPGIDLAGVSFQTRGGAISFSTGDGSIAVGDLTTRGADGPTGGVGSAVTLDANGSGSIAVGTIDTAGGVGASGAGGDGGSVTLIAEDGSIDAASVISSGGDGASNGGGAGTVRALVTVAGSLAVGDTLTPAVIAVGGNGVDAGGNANRLLNDFEVQLRTGDGDISVGAIDTRGGDASGDSALGGNGGDVLVQAGVLEGGGGGVTLLGNVDAREGASGSMTSEFARIGRDGGEVQLIAADHLEHDGQAGPHVRTTEDVVLQAGGNLGAMGTFVIEGSGERRLDAFGRVADHDQLFVVAGGTADVEVPDPDHTFLESIDVTATDLAANISVRQAGPNGMDEVTMAPGAEGEMVLTRAEAAASGNGIDLAVVLQNPDDDAPDGTLRLANGSVRAGRVFRAFSVGDLVLDAGAAPVIVAGATVAAGQTGDPDAPRIGRLVELRADVDGDGSGALLAAPGGGAAAIDLLGDSDDLPGPLTLSAAEGIGTANEPITVSGGGTLSATNRPRIPDPLGADPAATSGIFVRNTVSGDWSIQSAIVDAGAGDIELTNLAGDLRILGRLETRPGDPGDGAGGSLHLVVGDPGTQRIVLDTNQVIASGGAQVYDGDVVLSRDASLVAGTGVVVNGAVDTDAEAALDAGLAARVDEGGVLAVRDGLGLQRPLSTFELEAADADGNMALDALVLDTPFIEASAAASFDPVGLAQDLFLATPDALFAGDLDSAAGTPSALQMLTDVVEFQGDVGSASPLVGLGVTSPLVLFGGVGDQSVTTGAGGLFLGSGGPPLPFANIAKRSGGLRLESSGAVAIGDGDKLSVPGRLTLVGSSVRVTDLSALDIDVQAPTVEIFARSPGLVLLADGGVVLDGGTDLIANTVAFSSAPSVVGGGPAPRIATQGGAAQNAGGLLVATLPAPLTSGSISLPSGVVLDLAIPTVDPGHETPEDPEQVAVLGQLLASDAEAELGPEPSAAQVLAYLACAPGGGEAPQPECAAPPAVRQGSHLDTPRAPELAAAYRELLGNSAWARAGRHAVAEMARAPRPQWRAASLDPAARRYLLELARVLARARMLGLDEGYPPLREALLREVAAAIGEPELDAAALGAAAEANAMGLPI